MTEDATDRSIWPMRPWLLAAIGLLAGLLIDLVGGGDGPGTRIGWQAAASALFFFAPVAFGFTVERERWKAPLAFAAIVGLVMAGLAWRAVGAGETIADPQYGFLAGLVATALALPLFQAGFHYTRWATPYERVHRAVWDDAVCAAGSVAFLGASWLLLFVMSELFHLLKIDLVKDLMREGWFDWAFSGAAVGAALGTLRNEIGILGTLKTVVMVVLSILGVPLAAGLSLFLVAMIVSGPDVLWQATRSATPILLLCAGGAWVLANAILRDDDASMSGNRVLRWAAKTLALAILPLTVFAAVSLGTRIAQHGLSPERLWGLVAIAVATAYGLAWFVAVVRAWRTGWRDNLRRANLHLAVLISAVALLLALPILDFGAIAARSQVARLERGAVGADAFDYTALRWDFGSAGREALARLARSPDAEIAQLARAAGRQKARPYYQQSREAKGTVSVRVQPADPALERMVRAYVATNPWACQVACVALDLGPASDGRRKIALVAGSGYTVMFVNETGAVAAPPPVAPAVNADSKVEIRETSRRTIYVDGVALDPPLRD